MSTKTAARAATARKIVGSLGVIGTAAAVAGLGTFGTFSDSTTPVTTEVKSGTVSIDATVGPITVPATVPAFVPGDSMSRLMTLKNDGDSALSSVTLGVTSSKNNVLTSDPKGLRLSLKACDGTWTNTGTADAPVYSCSGATRDMVTDGKAVRAAEALITPASLQPGASEQLVFSIYLPSDAGNNLQGLDTQLSLTFTGTQRNGTAR